MKYTFLSACILIMLAACSKNNGGQTSPVVTPPVVTPPVTDTTPVLTIRGADLSFLPEIEQAGTTFYDSTGAKPALDIFKEYGCNLVRVRLWHTPAGVHSALPEVLAFCKKIQQSGLQILLDLHYSDTWADPSHQSTPAAWAGLSLSVLNDSVKAYSQHVIEQLKAQNTMPAIVQVGNEINAGMLWNNGKVNSSTDANWVNFAGLVKSGIAGVKAADAGNAIAIMLHYAETDGAADFYNNMKTNAVPYDIIGLSYYPWWGTKDLSVVSTQLNQLAVNFNKKIFIAETAYPWTLQWNDYTNNNVGETGQLITNYQATPAGQLQFLQKLKTIITSVPNKLGLGYCYWAPDWVAFKGPTATDGSSWENLAMFDFTGKALPAMQVFSK